MNHHPLPEPEKCIFGQGLYGSLQVADLQVDSQEVRLVPYSIRWCWLSIVVHNLVFILFGAGLCWGAWSMPQMDHAQQRTAILILIAITLLTCVLFNVITYFTFSKELKRGPILILNRTTGVLKLPRYNLGLAKQDVVNLQVITTKRPPNKGYPSDCEMFSELNVIALINGERRRLNLLKTIDTLTPFSRIVTKLLKQTDLPMIRVKGKPTGWEVTERDLRATRAM